MENARQFDVNLYRPKIGDTVALEVQRGAETLRVAVPVVERRDDPGRLAGLVSPERNLVSRLGILDLDLDREVAAFLPPLRKTVGVVVTASTADAFYQEELFQPGDVIYALNGKPITTLESLRAAVAKPPPGSPIVAHVGRAGHLRYVAFELEWALRKKSLDSNPPGGGRIPSAYSPTLLTVRVRASRPRGFDKDRSKPSLPGEGDSRGYVMTDLMISPVIYGSGSDGTVTIRVRAEIT